ncbi:MAG: hypothetical protein WA804_11835, partial [Terriglobales bacterium]
IDPIDPGWNWLLEESGEVIERVFVCPLHSCQHLFIGRYYRQPSGNFYLRQTTPTEPQRYSPPPEVQQISPDFCAIYDQAQKAEQLGWDLVSGPGYRKALEFLVKDYLTSLQTTDAAKKEIAELALMPCIKKYVTDSRMKATAERATWLGNDETHYIRKWDDKDLQDLKKFILLTCFWIQSEHLTSSGIAEMPQGKK